MIGSTKIYILRRLLYVIPVLFLTSFIAFAVIHLTPGDPVLTMVGVEGASEQVVKELREELGLNRPLYAQYFYWLYDMLRGNFGESMSYLRGESVIILIKQRLPVTLILDIFALSFALSFALPIAIISATHRAQLPDYITTTLAIFGVSVPAFWVGFLLIIIFSLKLGWLPAIGLDPLLFFKNPWQAFKHVIMPAFAISIPIMALITRMLRTSIIENLSQDYVFAARAFGIPNKKVIFRYVFRNSLIPTITVIGYSVRYLVESTVVVEKVFAIAGIGSLIADAVFARDFVLVQATVMVVVTLVVLANLIVDILYVYLDPRIKY